MNYNKIFTKKDVVKKSVRLKKQKRKLKEFAKFLKKESAELLGKLRDVEASRNKLLNKLENKNTIGTAPGDTCNRRCEGAMVRHDKFAMCDKCKISHPKFLSD